MRQSMENKIKNRILEHGNGWCFTPMHFADLSRAMSLLEKPSPNFKNKVLSEGQVVWVLKRLFSLENMKPHLIFKGGTSLSKVYGLIDRFQKASIFPSKEIFLVLGSLITLKMHLPRKNKTLSSIIFQRLAPIMCKLKCQPVLKKHLLQNSEQAR